MKIHPILKEIIHNEKNKKFAENITWINEVAMPPNKKAGQFKFKS